LKIKCIAFAASAGIVNTNHRPPAAGARIPKKPGASSAVDPYEAEVHRTVGHWFSALEPAPDGGLPRQRSQLSGIARDFDFGGPVDSYFNSALCGSVPIAAGDHSPAEIGSTMYRLHQKKETCSTHQCVFIHGYPSL
jgi:hypothetical protein